MSEKGWELLLSQYSSSQQIHMRIWVNSRELVKSPRKSTIYIEFGVSSCGFTRSSPVEIVVHTSQWTTILIRSNSQAILKLQQIRSDFTDYVIASLCTTLIFTPNSQILRIHSEIRMNAASKSREFTGTIIRWFWSHCVNYCGLERVFIDYSKSCLWRKVVCGTLLHRTRCR